MAAVPPKCNFKCWLPDINLARHTERKRLREREKIKTLGSRLSDDREQGEEVAPDLAAVAALFVSLMSVRVPHRPEKHEYNKMKMKDTCAGCGRVWGGGLLWVELMCLCSILHRMLPRHFGNVSLTSGGRQGRG